MLIKENPQLLSTELGAKFVDLMYELKDKYPSMQISIKDFLMWQNKQPDPLNLKNYKLTPPDYLEFLCKNHTVYIVSNSSKTHILYYIQKFNFKPSWFKDIICNNFTLKDRTKLHYYKKILDKEKCNPETVYVFGDNFTNDLLPAKKLNMQAYLVNNAQELPKIIDNALKKQL